MIVACTFSVSNAQSTLENPTIFAPVLGLNTIPDHGNSLVSFLDYRDGYVIMAVDVASHTEVEIERIFYAEPVVSTYGDRIAWIGYTASGPADVYVHDRSSGSTTRITSDSDFQNHADLSADVVVWQDYRNADVSATNADIFMHEFASKTTTRIATDPGYQDLPRVHGQTIVWQDYRHADTSLATADIYVYDLAQGEEQRITSGTFYRTHPAVWNDLVVWEDYRNGENGDIYLYDLSDKQELRITTDPSHQGFPSVYGGWVLWLDYRNSLEQGDLYGYHLKSEEEYALLVHPAHQERPSVHDDHVVWQDYRNGRFDLFEGTLVDPAASSVEASRFGVELTAAPNPFSHSVRFFLTAGAQAPLELTIHDSLGRVVARRLVAAGETEIVWNGRADSGWMAAPGVYIASLRGNGLVKKVLIARPY